MEDISVVPTANENTNTNEAAAAPQLPGKRSVYMFAYILVYAFHGCLLSLPGTIYMELQSGLQTSSTTVSWIYSTLAISAAIAAFISGAIVQKFKSTQRWLSAAVFFEVIALALMPFTDSFVDVMGAVFVFRTYPVQGQHMFFITQTVLSITSTAFPLFVQLSISTTDAYFYPVLMTAIVGFLFVIISCFLSTPQHDTLRHVKRRIAKKSASRADSDHSDPIQVQITLMALEQLSNNVRFRTQQYVIIALLIVLMLLHLMIEFGANAFITTYVVDYLQVSESYGRYLISVYFGCTLLGRMCTVLFTKLTNMTISPVWSVSVGFVARFILIGVLWTTLVDEAGISLLFAVFAMLGFFASSTFPGLLQWGESVMSVDGMVSCLFLVGNQTGIAIIAPITGSLIQSHSAQILPFVLMVPAIVANILVVINVIIYKKCYTQLVNRFILESTTHKKSRVMERVALISGHN